MRGQKITENFLELLKDANSRSSWGEKKKSSWKREEHRIGDRGWDEGGGVGEERNYKEQREMRRDIEKKRRKTERGSTYRYIILKLLKTKNKIYKVARNIILNGYYNIWRIFIQVYMGYLWKFTLY